MDVGAGAGSLPFISGKWRPFLACSRACLPRFWGRSGADMAEPVPKMERTQVSALWVTFRTQGKQALVQLQKAFKDSFGIEGHGRASGDFTQRQLARRESRAQHHVAKAAGLGELRHRDSEMGVGAGFSTLAEILSSCRSKNRQLSSSQSKLLALTLLYPLRIPIGT